MTEQNIFFCFFGLASGARLNLLLLHIKLLKNDTLNRSPKGETTMGRRKINTEAKVLAAVREDGKALRYMPENLITEDVCL